MRITARVLGLVMLAATPGAAQFAPGSPNPDHPTLAAVGEGQVMVKPTSVELTARVVGSGELTADALVKYRDARQRAVEVIEALGIENLTVTPRGASLTLGMTQEQVMAARRGGGEVLKPSILAGEDLLIRVTQIDQIEDAALLENLAKIIDAAQDLGLQIGPAAGSNYYQQLAYGNVGQMPVFLFRLDSAADAKMQARKLALGEARKRVSETAQEVGLEPVRVLSVTEDMYERSGPMSSRMQSVYNSMNMSWDGSNPQMRYITDSPAAVPVTARVTVLFLCRERPTPKEDP